MTSLADTEPSRPHSTGTVRFIDDIRKRIAEVVVGQDVVVERLLIALFTGGHLLLQGVPGLAKTLLVAALSRTIDMLRARQKPASAVLASLSEDELQLFYYDYRMLVAECFPEYEDEERDLDEGDVASASSWVVAQGKTKYLEVWNDPSLLPNPSTLPSVDYSVAAAGAYYNKYGKDIAGRP